MNCGQLNNRKSEGGLQLLLITEIKVVRHQPKMSDHQNLINKVVVILTGYMA